jgi:hypothetical protein
MVHIEFHAGLCLSRSLCPYVGEMRLNRPGIAGDSIS